MWFLAFYSEILRFSALGGVLIVGSMHAFCHISMWVEGKCLKTRGGIDVHTIAMTSSLGRKKAKSFFLHVTVHRNDTYLMMCMHCLRSHLYI